jgi:predicted house-cleaning noncanonical NTP pyrophosphatase (MazG superfamily)
MKEIGDIDIDVQSKMDRTKYGTRAIQYVEEKQTIKPHASGYYIDDVPVDPVTGMSTVHFKEMEALGFIKVDLITNTVYDGFSSKQEVLDNLNKEPDWSRLLDKDFVQKLPHLKDHMELLEALKPQSIEDLADVLALIRPGKIHLIDDYIDNKSKTRKRLYSRPKKGYYIKKSHAVAYAHMIVCVMNSKETKRLITWRKDKKRG